MRFSLIFLMILFSLSLVSATTPLEEFLDTWNLSVTIAQDNSTAEFIMDLSNTSFNQQDFQYKDFTIENIYLSSVLDGIDFKTRTEKGWNYTQFESMNIKLGTQTQFLMDNIFVVGNVDLTCSQINNNITLFNEFLLRHPLKYLSDRTIILEKQGTNYKLYTNTGWESVDRDYRNQIEEIMKQSIYSVNVHSLVNKAIPLIDYNLSFLDELDLNYQITIMNLDEIEIENGEYNVDFQITHENTNITKTIKLTLKDIPELEPIIFCGDGICNNGETCSTCLDDCGKCSGGTTHGSSNKYVKPTKIIPNETIKPEENKTNEEIIIKPKEKSFWEENKTTIIASCLLVLLLIGWVINEICKKEKW